MVNKYILFNYIDNIMEEVIDHYFNNSILIKNSDHRKLYLKQNITKELNNNKDSNYLWYITDYICYKKLCQILQMINKIACCKHCKLHVPKKRSKLNKKSLKYNLISKNNITNNNNDFMEDPIYNI